MNDNKIGWDDDGVSEKLEKFNRYEKLFFRIELGVIAAGIGFYILFLAFIEGLGGLADLFISIFLLGWIIIILNFFIAIIRMFKYGISIRKEEGPKSIWRSFLTIILSTPAFVLYYILIFVSAISSCAAL